MEKLLAVVKATEDDRFALPYQVREYLGIRDGDEVLFVQTEDGDVSVRKIVSDDVDRQENADSAFDYMQPRADESREEHIQRVLRERDSIRSVTIPEEALHEEFDDETVERLGRIWLGEDPSDQS